ncbi:predicted pyridoxal phosphate-dependent transferase [Alteracholeplasma palmae J233]|uniref:cysteine-S-conjugate beta-lyase n=1 Tax=Alteracholeplasma palmae (strain ATCC 49389 / J233) TaxID=1318466 RepID=U4KL61_ALTPJ|nr:PatB family C-S lyase [Alteracholeplasma palmae]CCV64624.1 predicted pyridoxal phosphate-dependent transferase [Alteracholeplasma palmae J233]
MNYNFKNQDRSKQSSNKWERNIQTKEEMKEKIFLSVADADFLIAPEIEKGLSYYIKNVVLGYNKPSPNYYLSVIKWMKQKHDWDILKESIVITPGVVFALYNAITSYTHENDGVIIFSPVYPRFNYAITDSKRALVSIPLLKTKGSYEIDFELFESEAKKENNKMLILCSPHNPVGRVWNLDELQRINQICIENNIVVISDEIHNDLVLNNNQHTVFSKINKKSIICTSPSKAFNMGGLQVANIIIEDKELREKFVKNMGNNGIHMGNILSLKAVELAYNNASKWLENFVRLIEENYQILTSFISEKLPQVKVTKLEGTYLVWLDFSGLKLEHETLKVFLETKCHLEFSDGISFGKEGYNYQRMNIACDKKTLMEVLHRLEKEVLIAFKE